MTHVSDRTDIGYFPLQDFTADGTKPEIRLGIAGFRVGKHTGAGQRSAAADANIMVADENGMGTIGDIRPWFFWQTRGREHRGMGSWAMAWASICYERDAIGYISKVQPVGSSFMENDTRYETRTSWLGSGMPSIPGGAICLTVGTTSDEEVPNRATLWADPRLIAVNTPAADGTCGTLVCDLDANSDICMAGVPNPGTGQNRTARLQTLVRVITTDAEGVAPGGSDNSLNILALQYGLTGVEGTPCYGAIYGPLGGVGGPTTGSGGGGVGGPTTGSGGGGSSSQANFNNPPSQRPGQTRVRAGSSPEAQGFVHQGTDNGFGGFQQASGGETSKEVGEFGSFVPQPQGNGVALMAAVGGFGPIHLGSQADFHQCQRDAEGNPVNSAHISTNAYFYANPSQDAPLDFAGIPYPQDAKTYPHSARVHLAYDMVARHFHLTGAKMGKWKWFCEVPYFEPGPTTGEPRYEFKNEYHNHFHFHFHFYYFGRTPGGGGDIPPPIPDGPTTPSGDRDKVPGNPTGRSPTTGSGGKSPNTGGGDKEEVDGPTTPGPRGRLGGFFGFWFGLGPGGWRFGLGWLFGPGGGPRKTPGGEDENKTPKSPDGPTTPGPGGSDGGQKHYPEGGTQGRPAPDGPTVDPGDGYNPDHPHGGSPTTPRDGDICNEVVNKNMQPWEGGPNNPIYGGVPGDTGLTASRRGGAGSRLNQFVPGGRRGGSRSIGSDWQDPRQQMGRWSGRNVWTREPEQKRGVVDHIGGTTMESKDTYTIFHPLNEAFSSISFRPQLWIKNFPHFERNPQLPREMVLRDERTRPQVLTMRAWGAQDQDTNDWTYKQAFDNSRARGGTADGGIMFSPPRFEGEDYFGLKSQEDVEDVNSSIATENYVLATPGVAFALGRPDTTGGLKTGGITIKQLEPASDRALQISQDSSELIKAYDASGDVIVELGQGGTGAIVVPKGTTAQRPTPAAGMVRVRTGGITDILEFYDSASAAWVACSPDGSVALADIAEGGTGATTVDGAVSNFYLNIAWDHLLPHDQNGSWNKQSTSGGGAYQANQGAYTWTRTADVQGVLVVSSDAGTSATTGSIASHTNYIGYAATDSIFYLRVSVNYTNGAKFRWGVLRNPPAASGDVVDGAYFEYDSTVSANIYACTAASSSRTKTDTGRNISGLFQSWRTFAIKKTAAGFEFFDLDASTTTPIATHTTNIPTTANLSVRGFIQSVYNGTTYRSLFLDAFGTEIATGWFPGRPS